MSTTISIRSKLSPADIRLLEALKQQLDITTSEVVSRAIRLMAFNVGLSDHIEKFGGGSSDVKG